MLAHGFARARCATCRDELLVPCSCKTRGQCPSCGGRRIAAGVAHLVDHVLPRDIDYRQWTLSLPHLAAVPAAPHARAGVRRARRVRPRRVRVPPPEAVWRAGPDGTAGARAADAEVADLTARIAAC